MERQKLRTLLRTVFPLLGFMLLIYLGYTLLLSGPLAQRQQQRAATIANSLDSATASLEQSLLQLDSAQARLEAARLGLIGLPGGPSPMDSVMLREMDSTQTLLEQLRRGMAQRRDSLHALRSP
ncbi:MAG TPA: hypothetical protein P5550_01985 [Bacteroidales bacterium]|nr:hypothetical protein [Bacteroidales bacterium]HRZ76144.1 hypothetical protein [Bacteroidales bacterium]